MTNSIWVLVPATLLVAGLLLVLASGQSAQNPFVHVAEGFASESEKDGVQLAFRMFSVPDLGSICAAAPNPARLIGSTTPIEIPFGEPFALSRIVVVARDSKGNVLRRVPITLEVEDRGLFFLRSDAIAESKLQPLRAGRISFRARALCPEAMNPGSGTSVSTIIPAIIRP